MRTFVHFVIAIAVAISFAGCGKKPVEDSAHVKRAKELMSIGEWSNASTELKIELKDKPKDLVARGLLLYCVEQNVKMGEDRDEDLFELYVALVATSSPEWERTAPADLRDETNKSLIRLRQEFYDKGVDTTDVADLKKVIETGAAFGFEKADKPEAKDHAAGILALAGKQPAIDHLVERLKGQSAEHVALYLVAVGAPVIPALKKVALDQTFLGRATALRALAQIQARTTIEAFTKDKPTLRSAEHTNSGTLSKGFVGGNRFSEVRAHAQFSSIDGGVVDGVLVLQSVDGTNPKILSAVYAFKNGELSPLKVVKAGASFDLTAEGVVYQLSAKPPGRIVVLRGLQKSVTKEVESGRVLSPQPGMRVRLQGYAPAGEIVRADEGGLWVVKTEAPIDGMSELTVHPDRLIGLRNETKVENTTETLTGKVGDGTLEIETIEVVSKNADRQLP